MKECNGLLLPRYTNSNCRFCYTIDMQFNVNCDQTATACFPKENSALTALETKRQTFLRFYWIKSKIRIYQIQHAFIHAFQPKEGEGIFLGDGVTKKC